jgi:hypothetical protein
LGDTYDTRELLVLRETVRAPSSRLRRTFPEPIEFGSPALRGAMFLALSACYAARRSTQ